MTQEEKQLLLKVLSAMLPYQPKLQIYYEEMSGSGVFDEELWEIDGDGQYCNGGRRLEDIKPYLRSMSSMTEEERKEYNEYLFHGASIGLMSNTETAYELIDWLNAHYFDYRGLITMGLALEAPEGMYKIKL